MKKNEMKYIAMFAIPHACRGMKLTLFMKKVAF